MAQIDLTELVAKLNDTGRSTLELAIRLATSCSNYETEVEHWLLPLLDRQRSDVAIILKHFEVDIGSLTQDINRHIDRFKTGSGRGPGLAPTVIETLRQAWMLASLGGRGLIRSGDLLLVLLDPASTGVGGEISQQLAKIPFDTLRKSFEQITAGSEEEMPESASQPLPGPSAPGMAQGAALERFTIDVTQQARDGKIDPIYGRDAEIRQIVDILTRRRQNNPILTGEAGVGKTAVVEGFALRIVEGDVPESLRNVRLLSLDLGLLQAGAGVKGEFENRLKSVISEVKNSKTPIIMFIDEAHTLIGAGGSEGQGDAANLLKPALARGEMRTVAATTWAEYKKYFEKDPALTRRFQVVKVEEPSEALATAMLRGLVPVLEQHHKVRILGEALEAASALSHRYISGRQLPDKAISLLDTACARVGVSQAATPPALENCHRRIGLIDTELRMLEREELSSGATAEPIAARRAEREELVAELDQLAGQWQSEREAIEALKAARDALEATDDPGTRVAFEAARDRVAAVRGATPMVYDVVDGQIVAEVLAGWTGIPVGRMLKDEIATIMSVEENLAERIKGQPYALEVIGQTVRTARADLADPRKPLGVFLFCGTSGVGKTETALALAELLYGGEQNVTTINMSEFKEEHKVSLLVGSPPGYVGYGEGGVLTEAVRRKPYSVVLLDEMEKAHPGVQDIFYQVFDKGQLKDGQGRDIDFKNTLIIMTSNAGTDTIERLCRDNSEMPGPEKLATALRPALLDYFKPAFLGRVVTVPFFPLPPEILKEIVALSLERLRKRVETHYGATFAWEPELLDKLVMRCTETESGARNIENILKRGLLAELAERLLAMRADGVEPRRIVIRADPAQDYRIAIDEEESDRSDPSPAPPGAAGAEADGADKQDLALVK
ncbi:MAG TPA: type VI secretion system ATPase TssH [Allosphingosinicella sp.]|jgi:type VI secretion system protein VasG